MSTDTGNERNVVVLSQPSEESRFLGFNGGLWFSVSIIIFVVIGVVTKGFSQVKAWHGVLITINSFFAIMGFALICYSRSNFENNEDEYSGNITGKFPYNRNDYVYRPKDFIPLKNDPCSKLQPMSSEAGSCVDFYKTQRSLNEGLKTF